MPFGSSLMENPEVLLIYFIYHIIHKCKTHLHTAILIKKGHRNMMHIYVKQQIIITNEGKSFTIIQTSLKVVSYFLFLSFHVALTPLT